MKIGEPFKPYRMFTGLFIPEGLARYRGIPAGAKMAWGRLLRYQGDSGDAYPSIATLGREIGVGTTQAREYIRDLVSANLIRVEQREGDSSVYHFLWHGCFEGEIGEPYKSPTQSKEPLQHTGGVVVNENPLSIPEAHPSSIPEGSPLRYTGDEESQFKRVIEREKPLLNSPLLQDKNQESRPDLDVADVDLQPDVPTLEFIRNAYRIHNRTAKLEHLQTKGHAALAERACQMERELGVAEFRGALVVYLADHADYLVEKRWPLGLFLAQVKRGAWSHARSHASEAGIGVGLTEAPAAVPNYPPIQPSAFLREIVDTWNRIVTAAPVDWDERRDPVARLRELAADEKFREEWTAVCERAQKIREAQGEEGQWLTFRWAIGRHRDKGMDNWWRVARGELNNCLVPRKRKLTPDEVTALAIAELEKEMTA